MSSLAAVVFMTAAFAGVLAQAANAANPTPPDHVASYYPAHGDGGGSPDCTTALGNDGLYNDQSGTGCTEFALLSDNQDGNTTVHLTSVASKTADRVIWYYCNSGDTPPAGSCAQMGEDDSGVTPSANNGGSPPVATTDDKAFDIEFAIPAGLEGQTRDVTVEACNGTQNTTPAFDSCTSDTVTNVLFDSGTTGAAPQTTAGDITSPSHGATVSDNGFIATASTSPSLDQVEFGTESSGDFFSDPMNSQYNGWDVDTCDSLNVTNPTSTTATVKTWSSGDYDTAHDSSTMDVCGPDATLALSLYSTDNTFDTSYDSSCANGQDACAMDRHWMASGAPVVTSAVISFPDQAGSSGPNGTCDQPITTASNKAGNDETVLGCLYDQGGTPVTYDNNWAFQVTDLNPNSDVGKVNNGTGWGFGQDDACGWDDEGTAHDTNSNGFREQEAGGPGASDNENECPAGSFTPASQQAEASISFPVAGSYSITFCWDSNGNGLGSTPSATPCTGETVTATGTKTVGNQNPDIDRMAFATDAAADASCTSGSNSTSAPSNSSVHVVQCVFDEFGNPVSGAQVQWFVNSGPGNYTQQQQTTGSNGQATATFANGVQGTQSDIYSCAVGFTCSNDLLINWQAPTAQKSPTHLHLGKSNRTHLFGTLTANNPSICTVGGRTIKLFQNGHLKNVTHTNAGGSYHFTLHKAKKVHKFKTKFPGTAHCGASTSNIVKSKARA